MKQINLLCVILTCYSATSLQFYSHKASTLSNPSWMSQLDNGIPLRQVSIIGSHSSMSQGTWGDAFQTQSNSLTNQMVMGMRALDIRCRHYQDKLQVYVRIISLNTDLGGVLSTVRSFLQVQNMEVILMHIVEEGSASGNSGTFQSAFLSYYNNFLDIIWTPTSQNPFLGEVRGKVVIIQDFTASAIYGLLYSTFTVLPHKTYSTNWDQYDKWLAVKSFLVSANAAASSRLSFWTGNVGSFPYFVASGQSSPSNGDPLLSTGLTTPGFKSSYPDFPRVACFIGICTIAFQGINNLAFNYVLNNNLTYMGVVFTDFIGDDVITRTINLNKGKFVPCPATQITQGCSYCSSTGQCLGCNTTSKYVYNSVNSSCLAAAGYYLAIINSTANTPTLCSTAIPGCLSCSSSTLCLTCDILAHYSLVSGTCAAAPGYYLDPSNVPVICSLVGCYQCQSASLCLICSAAQNYILNPVTSLCECDAAAFFVQDPAVPACICMAGFYLAPDNTCQPVAVCPANNSGCVTCDATPSCSVCDAVNHFIGDLSNPALCVCQTGYYFDGNLCQPCSATLTDACLTCASQNLCLSCQTNFTLTNGDCVCLSQYYSFNASTCVECSSGCLICSSASMCQACDTANHFFILNNTCTCLDGMYLNGTTCLLCAAIPGCLTCTQAGCTSCDPTFGFTLNPTSQICQCALGYYINSMEVCAVCSQVGCLACTSLTACSSCSVQFYVGNGICLEVCGDGVLYTLACDDGNLVDDDGCSSSCQVQTDYTCVGGSSTSASSCSFSGNLSITVVSMTKDPADNKVYLSANISPALAQLATLDFSTVFVPDFDVVSSTSSYDPATGNIALTFTYNTSLNDAALSASFVPPALPAYFYMPTTKVSLPDITNNNLALKAYSTQQYQIATIIEMTVWGIALGAVGLFLVGFFFISKLIAIEMLLVFQLTYAGLLLLQKLQIFMVPLRYLKITNGYNQLIAGSSQGLPGRILQISYKSTFLSNFGVDAMLFGLLVVAGIGVWLIGKVSGRKQIRVVGYKILKQWVFSGLLLVQSHLGVSLFLDILYDSQITNKVMGLAIGGVMFVSLLVQLIVFVRSPNNFGEYKQFFKDGRFNKNWYILVTLCRSLISISLGYFSSTDYGGYVAIGVAIGLLVAQTIVRPYESNIRPFVNNLTLISILSIYQYCKLNRNSTEVTISTTYMAFFLMSLLVFALLFNLICMVLWKVQQCKSTQEQQLIDERLLEDESLAKNIDKGYVQNLKEQMKRINISNKDMNEVHQQDDEALKSARKLRKALKNMIQYELQLSEEFQQNVKPKHEEDAV